MSRKQPPSGKRADREEIARRRAGEAQRERLRRLTRITRIGVLAGSATLAIAFADLAARHSNVAASANTPEPDVTDVNDGAGTTQATIPEATATPTQSLFAGQGSSGQVTATPTPKTTTPKPTPTPRPTPQPPVRKKKHHSSSGSS